MSEVVTPIPESVLSDLMALDTLRDDCVKVVLKNASAVDIQNLKCILRLADAVPALVAEIRRLKEELKTR